MKVTLIEGLVYTAGNVKLVEGVALIIADLIVVDSPETWAPLIGELSNWFQSEEEEQNISALEAFLTIMARTDDRSHVFIPHFMPHLFPLFSRAEVPQCNLFS